MRHRLHQPGSCHRPNQQHIVTYICMTRRSSLIKNKILKIIIYFTISPMEHSKHDKTYSHQSLNTPWLMNLPCLLNNIATSNRCRNYTVFQKSDAKIQITITTAHLIRINYPLSSFNYRLSSTNVANFNKIHRMVSEQQLFKKMELKNRLFQYGKYRLAYLLQKVFRIMT